MSKTWALAIHRSRCWCRLPDAYVHPNRLCTATRSCQDPSGLQPGPPVRGSRTGNPGCTARRSPGPGPQALTTLIDSPRSDSVAQS